MRIFCIIALLLALAVGCASVETVDATALPLLGTSPMYNTQYVGSDDNYHHFVTQQGLSVDRRRIPVDAAKIEPVTFSRDLGRSTFVVSAEPGVVTLFDPLRNLEEIH